MRKIVTALILVPMAILVVAFAVANRRTVIVSFDPFDPSNPAFALAVPLFGLLLVGLICGVVIGGAAAWIRQSKWRRTARLAQARARELHAELDQLKRDIGMAEAQRPAPGRSAPRLIIPPPAA
jgi:uncharacterized membrane protein YciS (DUF1049 family)